MVPPRQRSDGRILVTSPSDAGEDKEKFAVRRLQVRAGSLSFRRWGRRRGEQFAPQQTLFQYADPRPVPRQPRRAMHGVISQPVLSSIAGYSSSASVKGGEVATARS